MYNKFLRFGLQYSYSEWYELSYTNKLGDDQDNDLSRTYAFKEYQGRGESSSLISRSRRNAKTRRLALSATSG